MISSGHDEGCGPLDGSFPQVAADSPSPMRSRLWRWQVLVRVALASAQRRGPLLELRYRALPGVSAELAVLVAEEARHCSLLTWTLEHRYHGAEEQLVVRIEAGREHPDDIAAIALFVDAQIAAVRCDGDDACPPSRAGTPRPAARPVATT
jgi:hypothetical protein